MTKPKRKNIILITLGVIVVAAIIYGFLPGAQSIETTTVKIAPLQVIVEEEGETYVKQSFMISSPVAAFVRRIDHDPGDDVEKGDSLVLLEPPRPGIMDLRSHAEAKARVDAAQAALERAKSQVDQAIKNRERTERLARVGSATQEQVEEIRTQAAEMIAIRNSAQAELKAARAKLSSTQERDQQPVQKVLTSPVSGQVLAIYRRSEGPVNIGDQLIEVGDIENLEVRIDVLSQDAVRIVPGMRVLLDQWGGEETLEAKVTKVESQAKVIVSALGVEERRVQVISEFQSPAEIRTGLGSGYRVLGQFIIWEDDDVLQVPTNAIFRTNTGWGIFVVEDEKAVLRTIRIGKQTGLSSQVLEGLSKGEKVIIHPGEEIEDGTKVKVD